MIEKQELGEFYKELRLARKLKQSDVACDGLTASQLSKFELGQSMLSADKLSLVQYEERKKTQKSIQSTKAN